MEEKSSWLNRLGGWLKQEICNLLKIVEFCHEKYDEAFGYPWGGMIFWAMIWLVLFTSTMLLESANGL